MSRYKCLSIIVCLFFVLNSSAQTITLNPSHSSWPTYNDTGDMINGFEPQQAHFAFDLSGIPDSAQIVSATFSAYFKNGSYTPSSRQLWYNSNDSWINTVASGDPGNAVVADEIVGTLWHDDSPSDGYVWRTITVTYDGWSSDLADNVISFMVSGGQFGVIGLYPGETGYTWGVEKEPELTLSVSNSSQPIIIASPNGGESWQAESLQTITWFSNETSGDNVKIELYKDDTYVSDIIASTANDGEYTWQIPSVLTSDTTYKIKIIDTSDTSKYDFSNNYFSISDLIPSTGTLSFKSSTYSVNENGGAVRIYVSRTGGSSGAASINYNTSNGNASSDSDYTQTSGILIWENGDAEDKYFDIPIINDSKFEDNEHFIATLNNPIGADMGNPSQTTIIIIDDDSTPPVISLPEVATLFTSNVTSSTAKLFGLLNYDGSKEIEENCFGRFYYWKSSEPENIFSTDWQSEISQDHNFSEIISGLDPNSIYWFYAQVKNSAGKVNGNTLKFKTLPDPNMVPVTFDPNEPNTLIIQNFVEVLSDPNLPHNNQGLLTYVEKPGNLDLIDSNDAFYLIPVATKESKIVSLISMPEIKGVPSGFYELSKDARPDNQEDAFLELSIYNSLLNEPNIDSENYLKFWLAENAFEGKTITIQQISSDPNITYPVWDVNEIISNNGRKMPLNDLEDQMLNSAYAWLTLSTSREILDIDQDGTIDLADYYLLLTETGNEGIYRSDIASIKNDIVILGIPDGIVDSIDENAFITEYNNKFPDNPIFNSVSFSEDFEGGEIWRPFISYGNSKWTRSNDAYEDSFSAKSGNIIDNQISILEVEIEFKNGDISFWKKTSSEYRFDKLIFYVDSQEIDEWSGLNDWEKVSYQISPGTHTLRWVYIKDGTASSGYDSVWIDNIIAH